MTPAMPATAAPAGNMDPIIPPVPTDCPDLKTGTITYGGLSGIQISAGAKPAGATAPMVFYWHGTGSTSGEFAAMAGAVNQGVMQQGGVLVSFQGTTGGDQLSGTAIFGMGDFKLTDNLLACAVKDHGIDPRKIYATGCSAGGLFTAAMLAIRSNYMAAGSPNSGGFSFPPQFQSMHTAALMTVHGAPGQDVVGLDFSQSSATADKAFKGRGGFVVNCNHGGGHCGGAGLAGDVWKFFQAHPFGVTPEPWAMGLPAGFNAKCMIYQ
jgi:predicted esterase